MEKSLVLLSGGLDSVTCLAWSIHKKYETYALSFKYGQKHNIELRLAKKNAEQYNVKKHFIFNIDLTQIGGSALTDNIKVPKNTPLKEIGKKIPVTYVPNRNMIFLSIATAFAEVNNISNIIMGVNSEDYSGYPDCRNDFIKAVQKTIGLSTKAGREGKKIKILTPLINKKKSEIIKLGYKLGVDYSRTLTCYSPINNKACGKCEACILRKNGFKEAGIKDPTKYV